MLRGLVTVLAIASCASAMPFYNGTNMVANPEKVNDPWNIVGGRTVSPPFKYPFLVALVQKGQTPMNGQFCGASLIAADKVLTAAHCCDAGLGAKDIDTLIHWQDLSKSSEGERVAVSSIKIHPQYDASTINYDVCVIKIAKKVSYTPVALDDGSASTVGVSATVAGWGNMKSSGSSFPSQAQEVDVPIIATGVCNQKSSYGGEITPEMLCAGFGQGGKDACQGDSGGPLFVGNTQVGVVSWGYGCALPQKYGVYARVSVLRSWIMEQVDEM